MTTTSTSLYRPRTRAPRVTMLCVCLLACMAVPAPAAGAAPPPPQAARGAQGVTELDQLFLDARHEATPQHAVTGALVARGPKSASELFDLLASGTLQVRVGERGRRAQALLPGERLAIIGAFERFPRTVSRGLLDERLEGEPSEATRLAALELLAAIGEIRDLDSFLAWAQTEGTDVRVARAVRAAFGERLRTLLDRAPEQLGRVSDLYSRANHSLLLGIVSAVASRTEPQRLEALGELLGIVPRFDAQVLGEISAMTREARFVPDGRLAARVRIYISSPEPVQCIEAIAVAEQLADAEAVPALIDRLEDRDMRKRAFSALVSITGEQLDPTAETWHEWHRIVTTRWERSGAETIQRAQSGSQAIAARAIQELALLRMYRQELVEPIAQILDREEVELVVLATATLGHHASVNAVPYLIAQLDKENLDVRRAGYRALRRLTGEDHGDDARDWIEAGWGVE